jgi:sirohydrochlorin cobaltochelatase
MPDGLLLVAHGSRSGGGRTEMEKLGARVADAVAPLAVELGFLELADPPAGVALDRLVDRGVRRVGVVPLMLHAAGHSKSDVPAVVLEGRRRHPGVDVRYGRPLGVDGDLLALARRRVAEAGGLGLPLALLSRGTSDPDANGEACKAGRLVAEATGAPLVTVGFAGVTWPSVPEALEQLRRLGGRRVTAFAWFLATGRLLERLRSHYAEAAGAGLEVVDAGYLGPCDEVARIVVARSREALAGAVRANCDACVHRLPFPGLGDRVGQPLGVGHSHLAAAHRHAADVG